MYNSQLKGKATVCLNMIVKNEAHIIRRTLAMLCTKIRFDYWVICDTGSTDATRDIIQDFFATEGIEGELHCDEWVNFAHNRTKALTYAYGKTDLLLVFDADDDIHGTLMLPAAVTHDEYHLRFGAPDHGTSYTRTLLINNRKRFQYYSVVHEYISCLEPSANEHLRICVLEGDYYVVSGRSGARNQDPDKYLKDATILASAHAEALAQGDPLHKRYAFYCANSYRDCGRREDAIRWYKVTLDQDNWAQEKYVSCLYLHQCYEALGQKEHGFFYLVKALHYDLERVECLHPLLVHYCCENANDVAYGYYRIVQAHYERAMLSDSGSGSKLFLETDKAHFYLPYYMIIVADRVGDRACGIRMYEIIFRKKQRVLSVWHLKNLFFNLRFFIEHVNPDALAAFAALANEYLRFVREIGIPTSAFAEIAKDFNYDAYGIKLLMPKSCPVISPNFSRSECKNSRAILFYAGYSPVPWNHSSMLRGALGGSERAVAHLSQELHRQGYTVYVSGGVLEDIDEVGVKYVGLSDLPELLRTTPFHTIVCSRYVSFLELYGGSASWHQFYIWAHDTHLLAYGCDLSDTAILEKWSDHIDGCVCQTRWHADEYARHYPTLQSKIRVINNGIDAALFPSTLSAKVRNRFIYTSRTERGLSRILDLWPDIIAAMPDATLVISTYVAFPCNDDERRIQARISQLNNDTPDKECIECIRHLGQLSPSQLYAEMGEAEYWLYPTDWPETSCITAMEMLMSGVICLYYPVAGLTDTMGGCGIQIAPGSELETLCRITSDETHQSKQREQERGRAYAEGCTWTHRAQQWVQALLHPHEVEMRVAIVNTLTCHYEMFGYILNYVAKKACGRGVTIFIEPTGNDWGGWLDFYKAHFQKRGVEFECAEFNKFSEFKTRKQFDAIFVPTDDDMGINGEWIDERFIAIEHTPMRRRAEYQHRIAVRPFAFGLGVHNRWALPCYDIVTPAEKMSCMSMNQEEAIHAAIVGGHSDHGNMDATFMNRISGLNGTRVKLHCVGARWMPHRIPIDLTQLNDRIELVAHGRLCAHDMIALLKTCDYVITDVNNEDHIAGKSMSGAIPLAFSTLTPIAMGKTNHSIYKFKTALEFDLAATGPIVLAKISNEVIRAVALERAELVRMAEREFDRCIQNQNHNSSASLSPIPKRVMQTWEHKQLNPQFQAIVDTWKTHNPHYTFVLMDATEREQFIQAHFERGVLTAYQRIVPGAYKSDLFRYCYLWVNGGVYADIDTLCLGSLDDFLIPGAELVVPIDLNLGANEGMHNLACGFIAAAPRHPALMRCIQKIVRNVETGTVPGSKLDFSGPGVLGRAVNECLNRDETASFVGNEGLHAPAKIHFLKFEPGTEFVKNAQNQVLFQNKNGNHEIASLYHAECCKLTEFVSWVQCASPIAVTHSNSPHDQTHAKPNVALMIYGQFRSYASNLRENVRMLAPVFRGKVVHVFVLSNKLASGNYSERNEREIRDIFDEAGFNLCFFDYVENLGSHHAENEQAAHDAYFAGLKTKDGVSNEIIPDIMYRKFVLNQIKNAHCKQHGIVMDLHVFGRLFDIIIRHPVPSPSDHMKRIKYEIDQLMVCSSSARTVLGSSDTLFIGTREPMDHLFECGVTQVRGPEIWNDHEFAEVMMRADSCLCVNRATYSPEVQYIAHMYFSGFKYRNIRFDFNDPDSPENGSSLYDIRLDPRRLQHQW
jgi:glycosyltransferase involved in cell wall biosynthesis